MSSRENRGHWLDDPGLRLLPRGGRPLHLVSPSREGNRHRPADRQKDPGHHQPSTQALRIKDRITLKLPPGGGVHAAAVQIQRPAAKTKQHGAGRKESSAQTDAPQRSPLGRSLDVHKLGLRFMAVPQLDQIASGLLAELTVRGLGRVEERLVVGYRLGVVVQLPMTLGDIVKEQRLQLDGVGKLEIFYRQLEVLLLVRLGAAAVALVEQIDVQVFVRMTGLTERAGAEQCQPKEG